MGAKMEKAVRMLVNRALAMAFNGWSTSVYTILEQREKIRKSLSRLRNRELLGAWQRWVAYVDKVNAINAKFAKAMMNSKEYYFTSWVEVWEEATYEREVIGDQLE